MNNEKVKRETVGARAVAPADSGTRRVMERVTVRLVPGNADRERVIRWLRDLIERARTAKRTAKDKAA